MNDLRHRKRVPISISVDRELLSWVDTYALAEINRSRFIEWLITKEIRRVQRQRRKSA